MLALYVLVDVGDVPSAVGAVKAVCGGSYAYVWGAVPIAAIVFRLVVVATITGDFVLLPMVLCNPLLEGLILQHDFFFGGELEVVGGDLLMKHGARLYGEGVGGEVGDVGFEVAELGEVLLPFG